ncbi:ATP-dependent Clp protease ATP-binding subunit, partial [candidate division WWE3 bacterium]|nr:ATP-dependent Clp protease ATP-binding subunit [candidate division WWE3 bacterium]
MNIIPTIVRYPVWYFVDNYTFWINFYTRTLILLNDSLALKATIKNLFKPYRQDKTVVGFAIGILVRSIFSIVGGVMMAVAFLVLTVAVVVYYAMPVYGFLLVVAISDYWWVNYLGVVLLLVPFVLYLIKEILLVPSLDEEGYPKKWQRKVYHRLELDPEAATKAKESGNFEQFLKEHKLTLTDYEIVREWVSHQEWSKESWKYWQDEHFNRFVGTNLGWVSGWMRESKYFTRDLTQEALRRKVYPWLGMDEIIDRVLTILTRDQHNNILLIGDPGVGKTSVIYAIAKRMNEYGGFSLFDLNISGMLAGGGQQGEFERRLNTTMREFREVQMILIIENVEQLLEAGVAHYFYPALQSGDFPIIATTTHNKLRSVLEEEGTFLNAFEQVSIPEPEIPDVLFILQEKVPTLEAKYKVYISYQAVRATVDLAAQYIIDRAFPTKAIDLLEETCASVHSGRFTAEDGKKTDTVERDHIEKMVTELTGVAVGTVSENEADKLIQLEQILHERVIGQDEAVDEIAAAMRRARSGLASGERPLGSFLFLGPTGVGKTQTAKTFAEIYFGDEDKMVRIDMSEYS